MTREQIVGVMQVVHRAWNARDAAALAAMHSEDGVVHSPMFGELRGRPAIERTFPDWVYEPQELIIDGDRVAQLFVSEATHSSELMGVEATFRKFKVQGVLIFELRDGKIAVERRLYDFTSLLLQVGVLKAKPAK
jgi:predicted ester cyclase